MWQFFVDECQVIEKYVVELSYVQQVLVFGVISVFVVLVLNEQSDIVYVVICVIICYGIIIDVLNKWCYFFDLVEVYLLLFWEQYINDENSVELIFIDSLLLVIIFNGYSLSDYCQEV